MTIDIRANVFCNLGQIIEGSLSDTYAQDNGLVFCRGSVRLDGLLQPEPGQVVDFGYQKAGWLARIPRRLRVLSSFADPFTRQTQIELGCKLTYYKDKKPLVTRSVTSASAVANYVPKTVSVQGILVDCLGQLQISPQTSLPFSNVRFNAAKFDIDGSYVDTIANLLKSLAYIGYLNESEQLCLINMTDDIGTGPVVGIDEIIMMEPIGVGEKPGDDAIVISDLVRGVALPPGGKVPPIAKGSPQDPPGPPDENPPGDPFVDPLPPSKPLWTYDESVSDPQTVVIPYKLPESDTTDTYRLTYVPFTYTITSYDDKNRVESRRQVERTYPPVANASYIKARLEFGVAPNGTFPIFIETIEQYKYEDDELVEQVTSRYEPELSIAAKTSLPYLFDTPTGKSLYAPSADAYYLSERTKVANDSWVQRTTQGGGNLMRIEYKKTTRTTEKLQLLSQEGQQAIAQYAQDAGGQAAVIAIASDMLNYFIIDDVQIQTNAKAQSAQLSTLVPPNQARPDPQKLIADKQLRKEKQKQAQLKMKTSQQEKQDVAQYDIPYTFEEYLVYDAGIPGYRPAGFSASNQLIVYARIQNRLRLAHRAGLSLQLAPELIPVRPFDPIYVNLSGLVGQYRVNATSWAFSASGIAAQVDAAFWGGVGTT